MQKEEGHKGVHSVSDTRSALLSRHTCTLRVRQLLRTPSTALVWAPCAPPPGDKMHCVHYESAECKRRAAPHRAFTHMNTHRIPLTIHKYPGTQSGGQVESLDCHILPRRHLPRPRAGHVESARRRTKSRGERRRARPQQLQLLLRVRRGRRRAHERQM